MPQVSQSPSLKSWGSVCLCDCMSHDYVRSLGCNSQAKCNLPAAGPHRVATAQGLLGLEWGAESSHLENQGVKYLTRDLDACVLKP